MTLAALAVAEPVVTKQPVAPRSLKGRERAYDQFLQTAFGRGGAIKLFRVTERDSARAGGCILATAVEYLQPMRGDSALRGDVPVNLYRRAEVSLRDSAGAAVWAKKYGWHSMAPFHARLLAAAPGGRCAVVAVADTTAQAVMNGQEPEVFLVLDRAGRELLRLSPYCAVSAARVTANGAYAALLDACEWPRWTIVDVASGRKLEMIGEDVLDIADDGTVSYYRYEVPRDPKTRQLMTAPLDSLLVNYKPHPRPGDGE